MTVKRYVAETAREALRRVKAELGPDAIVVSNKPVADGVEIVAMSADSFESLSQQPAARPPRASAPAPVAEPQRAPAPQRAASRAVAAPSEDEDYTVSLSSTKAQTPFRPWQPPRVQPAEPPRVEAPVQPRIQHAAPTKSGLRPLPPRNDRQAPSAAQVSERLRSVAGEPAPAEVASPQVAELQSEMQSIKALLERQLAGFAWGELVRQTPVKALLQGEMLETGFSGMLTRKLVEEMLDDYSIDEGRRWLQSAVNRRLRTVGNEKDLIDRGGVYALVGPTGVGKTTTTAKLAARCVVRYGADKLALLTTDGYRIGAHEQLKIYGRILGVPVHIVRDSEDLRRTLGDLRDKHMVLIDTVGMSQRDRMVAEQAAMLMRAGDVKRLLLLNATSRGDTLDDVIRAYAGEDLVGCILTKVDEAASLAPALDTVVRHGLLLTYIANGQRVPEDLHLANRKYLIHRAFKQVPADSAHRLSDEELGLVMAPVGASTAKSGASLV